MAAPTIVPKVLLVDDDDRIRRVIAMALELEGVEVAEARSLADARVLLTADVDGVVLDRQLPDGDGLELLADVKGLGPQVTVVVHSTLDDGREPAWVARADKGDADAILAALALGPSAPLARRLAAIDLVGAEASSIVEEWRELCCWDPMLPPETDPPLAREVVCALVEALERPQPLGWGTDPAIESVIAGYTDRCPSLDVAVGQLVCLREALVRHTSARIPPDELVETLARMHMLLDRAIVAAVQHASSRLTP